MHVPPPAYTRRTSEKAQRINCVAKNLGSRLSPGEKAGKTKSLARNQYTRARLRLQKYRDN